MFPAATWSEDEYLSWTWTLSLCESEVAAILHTEVDWADSPQTSCQAGQEYLWCLWKLSGSSAESENTNKWRWQYAGLERARHPARVSHWRSPMFGLFNETSSREQTRSQTSCFWFWAGFNDPSIVSLCAALCNFTLMGTSWGGDSTPF